MSEGRGRGNKGGPCHLSTRRYELLHKSLGWTGCGGGGQVVGGQASRKPITVEGWGRGEVGNRRRRTPWGKATFWGGDRGGVGAGAESTGGLGTRTLKRAHVTKVGHTGHLKREMHVSLEQREERQPQKMLVLH